MASTLQPSGPFGQVANLSFFFVALFGDVLLIRFFCTLAYIFLLIGVPARCAARPALRATKNNR